MNSKQRKQRVKVGLAVTLDEEVRIGRATRLILAGYVKKCMSHERRYAKDCEECYLEFLINMDAGHRGWESIWTD